MMLSETIDQYIEGLNLSSHPQYKIEDVKTAIRNLMREKRLQVKKTSGCPTLVPFFWYMGELKIIEQTIKSTGEGFNKKTAQMRCVGEVFERIPIMLDETPCLSLKEGHALTIERQKVKSSNGLSFALDLKSGVFSSYRELIERQVVLDYWFKKKKCLEIKGLNKWYILNYLSSIKNGLNAKLYYLPNDYGLFVICCHLSRKQNAPYNLFGYGCHESIEKAVEKAFLEAWRFYWEFEKIARKDARVEVKNFVDHLNFYALNHTAPAFFPKEKVNINDIEIKTFQDFQYDTIYIFDLKKYNIPGYCIKIIRNDFWDFKPGALSQEMRERKCGEVHPVA